MSTINISELSSANLITELTDEDLNKLHGGIKWEKIGKKGRIDDHRMEWPNKYGYHYAVLVRKFG